MHEPNFIGTILRIALGLMQISKESSHRTDNCSVTHQVRGWSLKNRASLYPAETDTICVHLYCATASISRTLHSHDVTQPVRASNCKIHPLTLVPLPTAELSSCTQYSTSRCQVLSNVNCRTVRLDRKLYRCLGRKTSLPWSKRKHVSCMRRHYVYGIFIIQRFDVTQPYHA